MSDKKKILVFTATYNEKSNISHLIKSIFENCPDSNILIIDDNSPDKTADVIEDMKKNFQNLFLIKREKKLGLDTAHKLAYSYALKNNYNYLITMDADFSHDPKEIKNFLKNLETCPFVLGSRYVDGGECYMKGRRLIFSKYGNIIIRFVLGINCKEFTTSYRGFNLDKLNNFNLEYVKTKGYSFFMGTIYEIWKRNIDIKEIPITFIDRAYGESKIPKIEIFRTLKNLIVLLFDKIFKKININRNS